MCGKVTITLTRRWDFRMNNLYKLSNPINYIYPFFHLWQSKHPSVNKHNPVPLLCIDDLLSVYLFPLIYLYTAEIFLPTRWWQYKQINSCHSENAVSMRIELSMFKTKLRLDAIYHLIIQCYLLRKQRSIF